MRFYAQITSINVRRVMEVIDQKGQNPLVARWRRLMYPGLFDKPIPYRVLGTFLG